MANFNGPLHDIKSIEGTKKSFLTFYNRTQKVVDVLWINYVGNPLVYKTLRPGQYFDVNTFVTHPWIFKDKYTRDSLVVDSNEIYMPVEWSGEVEQVTHGDRVVTIPRRRAVLITLPVYSLLCRTMQVIRNCMQESVIRECLRDSYVSINNLGLPQTLSSELVTYVKKSCEHMY